jgi:hypothetical protein
MSQFKINYEGKNTFLVAGVTKVVTKPEPDYVYVIQEEGTPERMWFATREDDKEIEIVIYKEEILKILNLGDGLEDSPDKDPPMLSQESFNSLEKDIQAIDIVKEKKELEDSLKNIGSPPSDPKPSKAIKVFGKKNKEEFTIMEGVTKEQIAKRKTQMLRDRILREQEAENKRLQEEREQQGKKNIINRLMTDDAPFPEMDEEEKQLIKALLRMGLKAIEKKIDAW